MSIKESIDNYSIPKEIEALGSGLKLNWLKNTHDVDIFEIKDGNHKNCSIGDDADYLQLFMKLAENLYSEQKDSFGTYLLGSNVGGERLYFKEFTPEEKAEVKYSYVSMMKSAKAIEEKDLEGGFSFYCEIVLEKADDENFEKQSNKVAKILKGENKEAWLEISEKKLDFLKVDMYIFSLTKLHSWGFQTINSDGTLKPSQEFVRAIRPKPRGAKLK